MKSKVLAIGLLALLTVASMIGCAGTQATGEICYEHPKAGTV